MKKRLSRAFCFALVLAGLIAASAGAQEWTRFRGPDGTGIGTADGIPAKITTAHYEWKVALPGAGHSSPVLWGRKIFLTCEGPSRGSRQVVCLSADGGKVLWTWRDRFMSYRSNRLNSFAASTPAVDARRIYLTWVSGTKTLVLALDHSGKKVWQRELSDFAARHGAGTSPIVFDGVVLVGNDHAGRKSLLVGLDPETGKTRWSIARPSGPTSYMTPTIYRPKGKPAEVIFASCARGVTSVDPASGKINWSVSCNFSLKVVASPVVAGGMIYVSTGRGGGRESAVIRPPVAGKPAALAFRLDKEVPYVPTPIAVGDYVYVLNDNGTLTCIAAATGKRVWREKLSGVFYPSPVCIDKRIYFINNKGEMTVIQAGTTFKKLATATLPERTQATPAIANGRMYIRTRSHLICVGPGR